MQAPCLHPLRSHAIRKETPSYSHLVKPLIASSVRLPHARAAWCPAQRLLSRTTTRRTRSLTHTKPAVPAVPRVSWSAQPSDTTATEDRLPRCSHLLGDP